MVFTLRSDLDPLDLEIVERAVQAVSETISCAPVALESDQELELALRRELAQMVRTSGVSDAEALLDLLIEAMREKIGRTCLCHVAPKEKPRSL